MFLCIMLFSPNMYTSFNSINVGLHDFFLTILFFPFDGYTGYLANNIYLDICSVYKISLL